MSKYSVLVLFLFFNYLINGSNGEIDKIIMDNLFNPMPPFSFKLKEGNPFGTVVSITGIKKSDTAIHYLNTINSTNFFIRLSSLHQNIRDDEIYNLAIRTEEKGYRLFLNGEEIKFIENTYYCEYIHVNQTGTLKALVYYNEPVWTLDQSYHNMRIYDYEPEGLKQFPKEFDLINFNSEFIQTGDFIIITGQMDDLQNINTIELLGDYNIPLRIRYEVYETQINISALRDKNSEVENSQSYKRGLFKNDEPHRFTITLYCEELGWRIYINGEETVFFYHHISPKYVKKLSVTLGSGKLLKVTIKHT